MTYLNVCAIIVSFNPEETIFENINLLLNEGIQVVLVDNNSRQESKIFFSKITNDRFQSILNLKNLGIASALNIGIVRAIKLGSEFIITFDQDSKIHQGYVKEMLSGYKILTERSVKLAILAPLYYDQSSKMLMAGQKADSQYPFAEMKSVPTSGNLIPSSIFSKIGFFRDDYFIDYVDIEFCMRCKKEGYQIYQTNSAFLLHNLGSMQVKSIFNRNIYITHHSSLRRYYISRNRWYTYLLYKNYDFAWVINDIKSAIFELVKIIFFEKDRFEKILCLITGFFDAFRGKMGSRYTE